MSQIHFPRLENAAIRVVDLQRCPLFDSLSPEQVYTLARGCQTRSVGIDECRQPLLGLEGRVVFIADGVFERIYLPDDEKRTDPDRALILQELKPGAMWGEHYLLDERSDDERRLALRASGLGRFLSLSASRFRSYLELWPEVQKALLDTLLQRDLAQGLKLGAVKHQLDRTDLVLDRIDSVAEAVLAGGGEQSELVQRYYLLKSVPSLTGHIAQVVQLEQAYLPGTGTREDRIRRRGADEYFKTSRFGRGLQRRSFDRRIDKGEYLSLMNGKEGRCIRKQRTYLDSAQAGVELVIDEIQGEGDVEGLVLLEVTFESLKNAQEFELPDWIKSSVEKDVTDDRRYSNRNLALSGRPE